MDKKGQNSLREREGRTKWFERRRRERQNRYRDGEGAMEWIEIQTLKDEMDRETDKERKNGSRER